MRDRGFVLVNVLVIIAALSVLAMGLLAIANRAVTRAGAAQDAAQGRLMLDAGVAFAARLLAEDLRGEGKDGPDHRGEAWALTGYAAQTPLGPVTVSVRDLDARFNLNRLMDPEGDLPARAWEALAVARGATPELAGAVVTRYAPLRPARGNAGDEEGDRMFQTGDLTHPAEMAALAGLADVPDLLAELAALPRARRINVNTATADLLAVLPGFDETRAAAILSARQAEPFEDIDAVAAVLTAQFGDAAAQELPRALLGTTSEWFEVDTAITLGDLTFTGHTILSRDGETGAVRRHAHAVEVGG